MKIFNYPFLVQKEILDHLSINHIFFLSLCSKRTNNFIIDIQKYQFQKVDRFECCINTAGISVKTKTVSRAERDLVIGLFSTPTNFAYALLGYGNSLEEEIRDLIEEIRVDVCGTSIDFYRCKTHGSDLHAKYCYENMESTIETIHSHLLDLLGSVTKSWLISISETTHRLPMLRNLQMLGVYGGTFEAERIDNIMSRSSCFEYFATTACDKRRNSLFDHGNRKVYDLDTVYKTSSSEVCDLESYLMHNFNGRHLFFSGGIALSTEAIFVLNSWKSGRKFLNLEVMSIDKDILGYNIALIRSLIEFKEVNTEVEYSFIRKCHERDSPLSVTHPWEFRSNLYIVRESDGHVASVLLTPTRIFMGVWKMTEMQFLERFS